MRENKNFETKLKAISGLSIPLKKMQVISFDNHIKEIPGIKTISMLAFISLDCPISPSYKPISNIVIL